MLDRIPLDLSEDAESIENEDPMDLDSSQGAATPLPSSSQSHTPIATTGGPASSSHTPLFLARQSSEIIGGSAEGERLTGLTGLTGSLMRSQSVQVVPSPSLGESPIVPNKDVVGGAVGEGPGGRVKGAVSRRASPKKRLG